MNDILLLIQKVTSTSSQASSQASWGARSSQIRTAPEPDQASREARSDSSGPRSSPDQAQLDPDQARSAPDQARSAPDQVRSAFFSDFSSD